jgi:hypothetical protein
LPSNSAAVPGSLAGIAATEISSNAATAATPAPQQEYLDMLTPLLCKNKLTRAMACGNLNNGD